MTKRNTLRVLSGDNLARVAGGLDSREYKVICALPMPERDDWLVEQFYMHKLGHWTVFGPPQILEPGDPFYVDGPANGQGNQGAEN